MKLRTFTAADMPSALKQIKQALGPDAVILSSEREAGRNSVRVTAAIDADSGQTAFEDFRDTIELAKRRNQQRDWLRQMGNVLEYHRLPDELINRSKRLAENTDLGALLTLQKITSASSKIVVETKTLATTLQQSFSFSPVEFEEPGKRICFVGPMGAGKTLATAKFATQCTMQKKPVSVITLDNERAGGVEQLSKYTDILNLPLHIADTKQQLLSIITSIPLHHITLIDTPGCNWMDRQALDELLEMIHISSIEPLLVIPAGLDSEETMEMTHSFSHANIKRLMVTRMDAASRLGNILAAASAAGLAFSHFSDSPKVIDGCHVLDADHLATFLLRHTKPMKNTNPNPNHTHQKEYRHEFSG